VHATYPIFLFQRGDVCLQVRTNRSEPGYVVEGRLGSVGLHFKLPQPLLYLRNLLVVRFSVHDRRRILELRDALVQYRFLRLQLSRLFALRFRPLYLFFQRTKLLCSVEKPSFG
jgi:hypothetical protein